MGIGFGVDVDEDEWVTIMDLVFLSE